jgi:hypothetical protein
VSLAGRFRGDGRAHALACQTLCRDGQRVQTRNGTLHA